MLQIRIRDGKNSDTGWKGRIGIKFRIRNNGSSYLDPITKSAPDPVGFATLLNIVKLLHGKFYAVLLIRIGLNGSGSGFFPSLNGDPANPGFKEPNAHESTRNPDPGQTSSHKKLNF